MSKKSRKSKLLVAISDTHCGSDVGLMTPEADLQEGNVVSFGENYAQQWLWECFTDAQKLVMDIVGSDPYTFLINGDVVEGQHHRTTEIIAPELDDHAQIAIDCLSPLAKAAQSTLVTFGTEVHTKRIENYIAKELKAVGLAAKNKWLFSINGVQCDACHHMSTTTRAYLEASQMSILLGNARMQASRAGHPLSRVFLRAHRHTPGHYSDGDCMVVVTGAFQMLTRYGNKVVPDSIPRPSVAVLDWRDRPEGALPVVHNLQYNPPQPEVLEL